LAAGLSRLARFELTGEKVDQVGAELFFELFVGESGLRGIVDAAVRKRFRVKR
jgi:hypothetical protein